MMLSAIYELVQLDPAEPPQFSFSFDDDARLRLFWASAIVRGRLPGTKSMILDSGDLERHEHNLPYPSMGHQELDFNAVQPRIHASVLELPPSQPAYMSVVVTLTTLTLTGPSSRASWPLSRGLCLARLNARRLKCAWRRPFARPDAEQPSYGISSD